MNDAISKAKRTAMAAAAVTAVGSGGGAIISPTPAAADLGWCNIDNRLCVWEDSYYEKAVSRRGVANDPYLRDDHFSTGNDLNDSISAVWNRANNWAKFYRDRDYQDYSICFAPGAAESDLRTRDLGGSISPIHRSWNDRISSFRRGYSSQPPDCDSVITSPPDGGCSV